MVKSLNLPTTIKMIYVYCFFCVDKPKAGGHLYKAFEEVMKEYSNSELYMVVNTNLKNFDEIKGMKLSNNSECKILLDHKNVHSELNEDYTLDGGSS
jgi:hypothetical protein